MTPVEHVVDGSTLRTGRAALAAFAEALSFPDYFGGNLDALYDCLTDLSWLPAVEHHVHWTHAEVLRRNDPDAFAGISEVLADAVAANPLLTVRVTA
ncbi:barstar family protein [Crossiella cryophila]|uniref:RNAse (Barnase) inhibitor barstar n=1 Tax=Crossiella cryophila TaxID=43355 RepID=A0A7W7C8E4_9PSEU|nr:barstar family protein [Crossiella cryophila]MBB4676380.1 RNAse (barnase) inhibitor barstar [Crossiella cryophila]